MYAISLCDTNTARAALMRGNEQYENYFACTFFPEGADNKKRKVCMFF